MDFISYTISIPLRIISLIISIPLVICGKLYDLCFKKYPDEPHTILITGGSSGICREIAIKYAKSGNTLVIIARNVERLNDVAEIIRNKGAKVICKSIDATDAQSMKEYIQEQDRELKFDLVVAGVGVVAPANACDMKLSELYDFLITANVMTCKNTVLPLVDAMRSRKHGQICILSSIAGLGMNFISPMYSSCKTCVYTFAEALRVILYQYGVYVNIVCPGYTDTPILDSNIGRGSAIYLSPEDVASTIVDGLKNDYAVIECNMIYNLSAAFVVRDMPQIARDYLYKIMIPVAKRHGLFVNEYPILEKIYDKEKSE